MMFPEQKQKIPDIKGVMVKYLTLLLVSSSRKSVKEVKNGWGRKSKGTQHQDNNRYEREREKGKGEESLTWKTFVTFNLVFFISSPLISSPFIYTFLLQASSSFFHVIYCFWLFLNPFTASRRTSTATQVTHRILCMITKEEYESNATPLSLNLNPQASLLSSTPFSCSNNVFKIDET